MAAPLRVAMLNRERALWPGGDLVNIDCVMNALGRLGVECEYNPADLAGFDIAHIWHVNFRWSRDNFDRAKRVGLPITVTPIYYPGETELSTAAMRSMLNSAKITMPFSVLEGNELYWSGIVKRDELCRLRFIPNGTDPRFHAQPSDLRSGVCCAVARHGNAKNSGLVAYACELAGLPYQLLCGLSPDEMPAAYRRHRMFVSASSSERMSLVVGEALCSGCRVISTVHNRGNEWYPGILTINPSISPYDLAVKLRAWYDAPTWDWRPNEAARALTWDATARMTLDVYREVVR